jgi:CelD/BcsL family acetyltransferase involved in cellulose biosynthesis
MSVYRECETKEQTQRQLSIEIATYHSFDAIAPMQQEWDNFIEGIGGEIFLTFDWCRVWWKYYGKNRNLLIFVFRKGGTLCGIMPMFSEHIRLGPVAVKVLKLMCTDFTPVAVAIPIQKESMAEVVQCFLAEIGSNGAQWDIIHLGPICGRYGSLAELIEACSSWSKQGFIIKEGKSEVHTYIKLAGSWEEQLATLSKKNRGEMKRKYDRLIQKGVSLECVDASPDNLPHMFDDFVNTHQSHWNSLGRPGHFGAWPSSYEFHREIAETQLRMGRLRFYQLKLNGNCIGYRYAYKFGDTYYCFLYARTTVEQSEKIDFARIDFGEIVKRGINEKVKWLDLMRGEYLHKLQLGGQIFEIKNIYLYSNRWVGLLKVTIFRALAKVLDISYYKIWRARIAPRVRFKQGPLWQLWIRTSMLSS